MSHTPGPWDFDFVSGMKDGYATLLWYFVKRDGDNVSIAADIVDPITCKPSEANARLIAAAPELLEALQAIVKSLADQDDEGIIEHAQQMIDARAAIAKARGQG